MECKRQAISHDEHNYVIDPDRCETCLECLAVCSTGSIDAWLPVHPGAEYSLAEQLGWDSLPSQPLRAADTAVRNTLSNEVSIIADAAHHMAPFSAATPQVNLFSAHAPAIATVVETSRLAVGNDVRHLVLDFGSCLFPVLEGQTVGILAPGVDAKGRPHAMRAYSIASARDGERPGTRTIALTVKRIVEDHEGGSVEGVCSSYLCDLAVGDRVRVVGPYGESFLAPNAAGTKILMVCTGTGIAPMRGMIEQRRRSPVNDGNDLFLFYGARSPDDMAYYNELTALSHRQIDLNLAFSRWSGHAREYVQDLLMQRRALVAELLRDEQCYIYLCGVRGMEDAVMQAFAEICCMVEGGWPALAEKLKDQRRLHIETY